MILSITFAGLFLPCPWCDTSSRPGKRTWLEDRHAFYSRIARTMALIAGLLRTTMLRDEPLDFIILGTMLERAGQTARILDVQHHALALSQPHVVVDTALWLALQTRFAPARFFRRINATILP